MEQVQDIAITVPKEGDCVPVGSFGLCQKSHTFGDEFGVRDVEIVHHQRHVADARVLHAQNGRRACGGFDDLDHGSVAGFDEDGLAALRAPVDGEVEMLDIPVGEAVRVGRGDGGVFDAGDHGGIVASF